jgi:hypothetical protein
MTSERKRARMDDQVYAQGGRVAAAPLLVGEWVRWQGERGLVTAIATTSTGARVASVDFSPRIRMRLDTRELERDTLRLGGAAWT